MKHAESVLGLKLFSRARRRYTPTREASDIFSQINGVYDKVEDLQFVIAAIERGADAELKIGSVPSIPTSWCRAPSPTCGGQFPNLLIDVDVLKIEEAIDYLLLGKGEAVAMSYKLEHPMLTFEPLAQRAAQMHRAGRPSAWPRAQRSRRRDRQVSLDRHRSQRSLWPHHGRHLSRTMRWPTRSRSGPASARPSARWSPTGSASPSSTSSRSRGGNWPGIRGIAHRRADRVPDLYRLSQGCDAVRATASASSRSLRAAA